MIAEADLSDLGRAKQLLENPGFVARVAGAIGIPVEGVLHALPERAAASVEHATKAALEAALGVAVATLGGRTGDDPSNVWHKIAVAATGAAGGAFGLPALTIELPVSTTVMLRSVADIARSKGEDLRQPAAAVACIEVFALGSRSKGDDNAESVYYAARIALAKAVSEAAAYLTEGAIADRAAPALARLIAVVAQRFGVVVTQKAAAQLVPVIGAAGGAAINVAFMAHFQDMAEGHFTVRALERKYGEAAVRAAYDTLPR